MLIHSLFATLALSSLAAAIPAHASKSASKSKPDVLLPFDQMPVGLDRTIFCGGFGYKKALNLLELKRSTKDGWVEVLPTVTQQGDCYKIFDAKHDKWVQGHLAHEYSGPSYSGLEITGLLQPKPGSKDKIVRFCHATMLYQGTASKKDPKQRVLRSPPLSCGFTKLKKWPETLKDVWPSSKPGFKIGQISCPEVKHTLEFDFSVVEGWELDYFDQFGVEIEPGWLQAVVAKGSGHATDDETGAPTAADLGNCKPTAELQPFLVRAIDPPARTTPGSLRFWALGKSHTRIIEQLCSIQFEYWNPDKKLVEVSACKLH